MSKVFCNKCDFYDWKYDCCAPDNLEDTYLQEGGRHIQKPFEKNKHSDCKSHKDEVVKKSWWKSIWFGGLSGFGGSE